MRPAHRWLLLIALGLAAVGGFAKARKWWTWKRFDVVEDGVLYRSGSLRAGQLEAAIKRYGIKTVFSFTFTNNENEQRLCDAIGVRRYFYYLPGNGVGPDDPYLRFLEVVADPRNHPILVHCSAGVQRTGGAVVLFRTLFQNWDFERAIDEMLAKGNDGNRGQIEQLEGLYQRLGRAAVTASQRRLAWQR